MTFKDMKYQLIVDKVTELFLEKGISLVTVKDVASSIGLGEATVYRYFSKKENLVVEVATKLEDKIFLEYFKVDKALNGFDSIRKFYYNFLDVFKNRKEFYRFISEFDGFVLNKDCQLNEYEDRLKLFYEVFINAYNKGLIDKTVKEINDINSFYLTTTHALMGLCKKLANSNILIQDEKMDKVKEIEMLIDIFMVNIKA